MLSPTDLPETLPRILPAGPWPCPSQIPESTVVFVIVVFYFKKIRLNRFFCFFSHLERWRLLRPGEGPVLGRRQVGLGALHEAWVELLLLLLLLLLGAGKTGKYFPLRELLFYCLPHSPRAVVDDRVRDRLVRVQVQRGVELLRHHLRII